MQPSTSRLRALPHHERLRLVSTASIGFVAACRNSTFMKHGLEPQPGWNNRVGQAC